MSLVFQLDPDDKIRKLSGWLDVYINMYGLGSDMQQLWVLGWLLWRLITWFAYICYWYTDVSNVPLKTFLINTSKAVILVNLMVNRMFLKILLIVSSSFGHSVLRCCHPYIRLKVLTEFLVTGCFPQPAEWIPGKKIIYIYTCMFLDSTCHLQIRGLSIDTYPVGRMCRKTNRTSLNDS